MISLTIPLHHSDLLIGQTVQRIHYRIDLSVRSVNLGLEVCQRCFVVVEVAFPFVLFCQAQGDLFLFEFFEEGFEIELSEGFELFARLVKAEVVTEAVEEFICFCFKLPV